MIEGQTIPPSAGPGTGLILALCDYTGTWSEPYRSAGWEVLQVDIQRGQDVRFLRHLGRPVHGILAAPPCTHFSRAGAHLWKVKGDFAIAAGLAVVDACLRAVAIYKPVFWVLENPIGRLKDYLGEPQFKFDPCDFGDPWTKRTWLWGDFVHPLKTRVEPTLGDITTKGSSDKNRRSKTPPGFAAAFFAANGGSALAEGPALPEQSPGVSL